MKYQKLRVIGVIYLDAIFSHETDKLREIALSFSSNPSLGNDFLTERESEMERTHRLLESEISLLIRGNPFLKPVGESLKSRNFSQALRRACHHKLEEVVRLLALYHESYPEIVVVDYNEMTSTDKTPLDLAEGNAAIEHMLRTRGAMTSKDAILQRSMSEVKEKTRVNTIL